MRPTPTLLTAALCAAPVGAQVPGVIRVEIDYMVAPDHSHEPPQIVLDAVTQMFACEGIDLILLLDEPIPELPVMRCDDLEQDFFTCSGAASFQSLKAQYAGAGAGPGWHYCIFGHRYTVGSGSGSSGRGEIGGNDFVVTLGAFEDEVGTLFDMAGTLAHELGHNLGLEHFSPLSIGVSGPYSPVYASVMSYQYQLRGVRTRMQCLGVTPSANLFKDLDYSRGRLPTLWEGSLSEQVGAGMRKVDWDCDGFPDASTVTKDLDGDSPWCPLGAGSTSLDDWNDWANLRDYTDRLPVHTDSVPLRSVGCITREEQDALDRALDLGRPGVRLPDPSVCGGAPQPSLVVESCRSGRMYWIDDGNPGGTIGNGNDPWGSLGTGLSLAPDHSVLYLQPGVYTNGGADVLIDRPLILAGPGTALVSP